MPQTKVIAGQGRKKKVLDLFVFKGRLAFRLLAFAAYTSSVSNHAHALINLYSETSYVSAVNAASNTQLVRYESLVQLGYSTFLEVKTSQYLPKASSATFSENINKNDFSLGIKLSFNHFYIFSGLISSVAKSMKNDLQRTHFEPYSLMVFSTTFPGFEKKIDINEIYSETYLKALSESSSELGFEHSSMYKIGQTMSFGKGSGDLFLEPFILAQKNQPRQNLKVSSELRAHIRGNYTLGKIRASVDYAGILAKNNLLSGFGSPNVSKLILGYRILVTVGGQV